jgi:hypothetical protein
MPDALSLERPVATLTNLYEQGRFFLDLDFENPKRLSFAHGLGRASIGQQIGDTFYRLTDSYSRDGGYSEKLSGLVAVEEVPDPAVIESKKDGLIADHRVGVRKWRVRPARKSYSYRGSSSPSVIENFSRIDLRSSDIEDAYHDHEYWIPEVNLPAELEGEELEFATQSIRSLLEKLSND